MVLIQRLIPIPVLAMALVAGGCKESTAPAPVDPAVMATAAEGLQTAFTGNATFQSLSALSGNFTLTAAAAALAAAPPLGAAGGSWPATAAAQVTRMRILADRAPAAVLALFPANVLGKTFVWDTAAGGKYRIMDSTLAGPSTGVRFRLYVASAATGRPVLPLQPIGYVDLIDVSTPQANVIRILVQYSSQTIADYTITGVKTTSSLTLGASGYVTDGVTPVNFDLSHALKLSDSSLVMDYHVTGNGATVGLLTSASGSGGNPTLSVDWSIAKGSSSVAVVGTSTQTNINVQFKFNSTTWATVSGDPSGTPTFTGANGRQLTTAELLGMARILSAFVEIADNVSGVFGPSFLVFK
jgi:hypothetical protein